MNQREVILAAWEKHRAANIHSPQIKKADAFFGLIAEKQGDCWEELADELRANYYDAYELIAQTLLETDDPLIVHNLIRFSDFSEPKELDAIKHLIDKVDPDRHEVNLIELAGEAKLQPALKRKSRLSKAVRTVMGLTEPQESKTRPVKKKPG
jgi:hypothetical protein